MNFKKAFTSAEFLVVIFMFSFAAVMILPHVISNAHDEVRNGVGWEDLAVEKGTKKPLKEKGKTIPASQTMDPYLNDTTGSDTSTEIIRCEVENDSNFKFYDSACGGNHKYKDVLGFCCASNGSLTDGCSGRIVRSNVRSVCNSAECKPCRSNEYCLVTLNNNGDGHVIGMGCYPEDKNDPIHKKAGSLQWRKRLIKE